jgi:hypothetical protein
LVGRLRLITATLCIAGVTVISAGSRTSTNIPVVLQEHKSKIKLTRKMGG